MPLSPIQGQWSLNESTGAFLSITRGIVAAATSDNVQVGAIVACEQFGNTLAICDETSNKIEATVLPSPKPVPIRFLRATVGVSSNDCATQLGGSAAGVRFLGLAAVLSTTLDLFNGARAIDMMLRSSTSDFTLLPTVKQLKDLLASLETRSYQCGFANSLVGWQTMLRMEALPHIREEQDQHGHDVGVPGSLKKSLLESVPSPEMVDRLVDTFRRVARIGESTITGATIKASAAVPWVVAFTKWCLGVPPSIYMEDKRLILKVPDSRVSVIIPTEAKDIGKGLEITIHDSLNHLSQLLAPASTTLLTGMVSVEKYGEWLLQEFGFTGKLLRVLHEALQYAIPQVLVMTKCSSFTSLGQLVVSGRLQSQLDSSGTSYSLSPLPSIGKIADAYSKLLNPDRPPNFVSLSNNELVSDLPLVSRYLKFYSQKCQCSQCNSITPTPSNTEKIHCQKDFFFRLISFIVMDILTLSLFNSTTSLLLKLSLDREPCNSVMEAILHVVKTGTSYECDDTCLISWAREMVGHKFNEEDVDVIMTSSNGQVVYPTLFDTFRIERQGYMGLSSFAGALIYRGEAYRSVISPYDEADNIEPDELINRDFTSYADISVPLNLFSGLESFWKISVQDNSELRVALTVRSKAGTLSTVEKNPNDLLYGLKDTLLLEGCPHDHHDELVPVDHFCSFIGPLDHHEMACNSTSFVNVVAVDGADDLRCFSLACTQVPVVLRRDACISCCLDLCREADVHVLVL